MDEHEYQQPQFYQELQGGQWESMKDTNHDLDGLVEAMMAVYVSFEMKLNCLFLTLQGAILEEVINRQGDNDSDILHASDIIIDVGRHKQDLTTISNSISTWVVELASPPIVARPLATSPRISPSTGSLPRTTSLATMVLG